MFQVGLFFILTMFINAKLYFLASFALPAEVCDPLVVSAIGVSGLITLALASYAFKNIVGFIYTSPTHEDLVKFSFLDFMGKRVDVEMKIDDVVPLSELPSRVLDKYFKTIKFNEHPDIKLLYKEHGITDRSEFVKVFGEE